MDGCDNTLYRFRGDGLPGQIPLISLEFDGLERYGLPDINKASRISVESLYEEDIEESGLRIFWETKGGVIIRVCCSANDPELKKLLKKNKVYAEKIIELLLSCPSKKEEYSTLRVGGVLEDEDIPEKLKPIVKQVQIWKEFLEPFIKNEHYNQRCSISVSGDGYFRYYVEDSCFKAYFEEVDLEQMPWDFAVNKTSLFDFDPGMNPPKIAPDGVYWVLEDKKVAIILPYESSSEHLAWYYNYLNSYHQFLEGERQKKERDRIRDEERLEEKRRETSEKKQTQETTLRKMLLD